MVEYASNILYEKDLNELKLEILTFAAERLAAKLNHEEAKFDGIPPLSTPLQEYFLSEIDRFERGLLNDENILLLSKWCAIYTVLAENALLSLVKTILYTQRAEGGTDPDGRQPNDEHSDGLSALALRRGTSDRILSRGLKQADPHESPVIRLVVARSPVNLACQWLAQNNHYFWYNSFKTLLKGCIDHLKIMVPQTEVLILADIFESLD